MGFTGIDVPGTANRQSKVPGLGSDQKTSRQSISEGAPNDQAHDESGYGSVSTSGIGDGVPGYTTRLSPCSLAAQDSGSNAAGFQGIAGNLNKGASGEGKSAIDGTSPEFRSTKAVLQSRHGNKELSVHPGALFPGIHD